MGVGMKHALEKALHDLFFRLHVCVCACVRVICLVEGSLEVCLCVLKFLGVCVCLFLLFCSTCLWLQLNKESVGSNKVVFGVWAHFIAEVARH